MFIVLSITFCTHLIQRFYMWAAATTTTKNKNLLFLSLLLFPLVRVFYLWLWFLFARSSQTDARRLQDTAKMIGFSRSLPLSTRNGSISNPFPILLHIWLASQLNKYLWRSVAENHFSLLTYGCSVATLHMPLFLRILFVPLFTIAVNIFPIRIVLDVFFLCQRAFVCSVKWTVLLANKLPFYL